MMYRRPCWWIKPIRIAGMLLVAVCAGLAFGMMIEALAKAIG